VYEEVTGVMRTSVVEENDHDSEGIIQITNPVLTNNEEGILKIYYNNCNGLQLGELLKEKRKEKKRFNEKRKDI